MSHGFPKRLRRQRREKRPQLTQPKSTLTPTSADKPISKIKTADLIADLSRPLHSAAFAEVLKEQI
jgi:hypothetical protein